MDLENIKVIIILSLSLLLFYSSLQKPTKKTKNKNVKSPSLLTVLSVTIIVAITFVQILDYLSDKINTSQNKKTINYFLRNREIRCTPNHSKHYLVSTDTNWTIYEKKYFKKDDLLIDISECTFK